jgi:tetratricopeptide (TPR) repeat protein
LKSELAYSVNRKSQIAIEYCYRWHDQHPQGHVIWIHASNQARLDQAYKGIAIKLRLPGCDDPETDIFEMVCAWLCDEDHGPWLLVLDSADDIETFFSPTSDASLVRCGPSTPLTKFLPRSPDGSMMVTTRDKRIGERLADRAKTIMVLPMANQEADDLLRLTVPLQSGSDEGESNELLDALGYLPLAITQAAAFINENNITVAECLEAFHANDSELLELLSQDLGDSRRDLEIQNSIVRTWKLSFDQISRQKPRAAELLSLMSVLDRQGIPKTLLCKDNERGIEFTTALGTLQAFSLIGIEKGGTNYEIHRLVQLSTQNWLELQDTKARWQDEALELLAERFPSGEYGTWNECEVLSPHAQVAIGYMSTTRSHLLQHAKLLDSLARYDKTQGRYSISCSRLTKLLDIREAELGKKHPDTLTSMNNLAEVLEDQGKYDEAGEMHRQVLELRETVLGKEHPDTLTSVGNLAGVLRSQGKYDEAEELHRQVLELQETVLGKEHPNTLTSMGNLAGVLEDQGKYDEAEELHRQALELLETVLGKEHPNTLTSMNNLAGVLEDQGKYGEAEELHRQALELLETVLGKEHPNTLTSMNNLALLLRC